MHRTIVGLFASAVLLTAAPPSYAGNLSNTAVTRDQFAAAFDITNPAAAFLESQFSLDDPAKKGTFRSEVFAGKGDNTDIFAYLYQIVAPSDTVISEYIISDFVKNVTAKINNNNVTSIYVSEGVAAGTPIDKFTVNGTVASSRVFVSDVGAEGVLVGYANSKIPAGDTSYIVGVFSKLKPLKISDLSINGNLIEGISYYTTVPEPSSLALGAIGLLGGLGCMVGRRLQSV